MPTYSDYLNLLRTYSWTGDTNGDQTYNSVDSALGFHYLPSGYSLSPSSGIYQIKYALLGSVADAETAGFGSSSYEVSKFDTVGYLQETAIATILHAPDPYGYGAYYTDVAKVSISETSTVSDANITFGQINDSAGFYRDSLGNPYPNTVLALTYNYVDPSVAVSGDNTNAALYGKIWLNENASGGYTTDNTVAGGLEFWSMMHEIGHALGLKHPDDPSALGADPAIDSQKYTIMSDTALPGMTYTYTDLFDVTHTEYVRPPSGLQLFDIAACNTRRQHGLRYRLGLRRYGRHSLHLHNLGRWRHQPH